MRRTGRGCAAGAGRAAHRRRTRFAAKTDRLVAWREDRSSRQVFNNKFKVFEMGLVLFAGEFYVNDPVLDGYRCICYKILTSEFCMDLRAVLGTV